MLKYKKLYNERKPNLYKTKFKRIQNYIINTGPGKIC
jgi:hypothetical protein